MIPPELQTPFHQSSHPQVQCAAMPLPLEWQFEIGETIWVSLSGGTEWILTTIAQTDATEGLYTVDTDKGPQLCSPFFISKAINPGHFVDILSGKNVGKVGFVVARNKSLLSIAQGRFGVELVSHSYSLWNCFHWQFQLGFVCSRQ